jgi:uncharacterized protein (TIGR03000 family)
MSRWLSTPLLMATALGITTLGPQTASAQFRVVPRGFVGGFGGLPFYSNGFYPNWYTASPFNLGYNPWAYSTAYNPWNPGTNYNSIYNPWVGTGYNSVYNPWSFMTGYNGGYNPWTLNPGYNGGYSYPFYGNSGSTNSGYGSGRLQTGTANNSPRPGIHGTIKEFYKKTMTPVPASSSSKEKDTGSKDEVARIEVKVPAGATVWFDGAEMESKGTRRTFVTPSLAKDKKHTYAVRARWTANGSTTTEVRRITVKAGDHPTVDFTRPAEVRKGNISTIPVKK